MDKNTIEKMIDSRIEMFMRQKQFNLSKIPNHFHNGTDSNRIAEVDLEQNNKNISGLIFDTSETVTLTGLNLRNIKGITLLGFAANNADGSPATKRAIINGEAQFGKCFGFTGAGTGAIQITTSKVGDPFIQMSNGMYVDSTDLTKNRVAIGPNLARAVDDTAAVMASLTIDDYTYTSLTLTCVVATNWKLQANIIIV